MITEKYGKVVKGLGGLYEVRIEENGEISRLACRAKVGELYGEYFKFRS